MIMIRLNKGMWVPAADIRRVEVKYISAGISALVVLLANGEKVIADCEEGETLYAAAERLVLNINNSVKIENLYAHHSQD